MSGRIFFSISRNSDISPRSRGLVTWAKEEEGRARGNEKYDTSQVEIVSGEVAAVKDIETKSGKTSGVGLELNAGGQNLLVYLGPHIYVDLQNVSIIPGDNVEIKGVKIALEGQIILLAGEVNKGGEVLKLRDDNERLFWASNRQRGGR